MDAFRKALAACGLIGVGSREENGSNMKNILFRVPVPADKACTKLEKSLNSTLLISGVRRQIILPVTTTADQTTGREICITGLSWIYTLAVLAVTLVNVVAEADDLARAALAAIPALQFILGVWYYSTSHSVVWRSSYPDRENYGVEDVHLLIVSLLVFTIQAAVIIPLERDFDWTMGPMMISMFIVSVINVDMWFVFYKHLRIIHEFSKKVIDGENINVLVAKVSRIKYDLDLTIGAFKYSIGATTLLGGVPIGYAGVCLAEVNCPANFPWGGVALFILYQLVFMSLLRLIDNRQGDIERVSKHPIFIRNYLSRRDQGEAKDLIIDNASSLDWQIFEHVTTSSWTDFSVLGIGITNGEIFRKGILLVSFIILVQEYFQ
jgi:hypothetical protein